MTDSTFLTRVVLKNYKSIATCDVRLGALSFLVGPNGSGKSNFLDALRFVSDALRGSLDGALTERGGAEAILHRSRSRPSTIGLRLEFTLSSGATGHYALQLVVRSARDYEIEQEQCVVRDPQAEGASAYYTIRHGGGSGNYGGVDTNAEVKPAAVRDRLYLVNMSSLRHFRPVYDALAGMRFYNLSPDRMREIPAPDRGELLVRDGKNVASVLRRIAERDPDTKRRIEEYLACITPNLEHVEPVEVGARWSLRFHQHALDGGDGWTFDPDAMSDGTLRALGVLVALFQARDSGATTVTLVGIEEPEAALHPAAAGVLLDSLRDASDTRQVIVTSHSETLLHNDEIDTEAILAVVGEEGVTAIGPLDDVGRSILRDHLFTAGELLRMDQLRPDLKALARAPNGHQPLFDA